MKKYWLFYVMQWPGLWEFMQANGVGAQHYPDPWDPPSARSRNLNILKRISVGDGIIAAIGQHRVVGYGRVRSPFDDTGRGWERGWRERIGVDWVALPSISKLEWNCISCNDLKAQGYQVDLQRSCCANEIDVRSFSAIVQRLDEAGAIPIRPGQKIGIVTVKNYTQRFRQVDKISIAQGNEVAKPAQSMSQDCSFDETNNGNSISSLASSEKDDSGAGPLKNEYYRELDLVAARRNTSIKPASHQAEALQLLGEWFDERKMGERGGILVLPTGGGKTFVATRFLCNGPISQGFKVLWLAHTHHLLEQALESIGKDAAQISEPKQILKVRVVSGTPGHCHVHEIKKEDDVVICTLQTMVQACKNMHLHQGISDFLNQAKDGLCVVFDEAHHAPAHSYRTLIEQLRDKCKGMILLGLTATPTYTDESKQGWLSRLFPQGILSQVSAQKLMADGILAQPLFEEQSTKIEAEFDEREYQKWRGTYRDLPEEIVTQLALNRDRNLFIANTYIQNRDKYGKTIIFADRWFQCEQVREFLCAKNVRADVVYSHVDADPGSAYARNSRNADENKKVLESFKKGDLEVLINVRMLTEGTDVPKVDSVFLTRQTTSSILLTQMIGRALRGPKFNGTDHAHIVSFIDNWRQLIHWADYTSFGEGPADDTVQEASKRPPVHLVSIELVRRLARMMNSGSGIETAPFKTLMPIGWYMVEFCVQIDNSEEDEPRQMMVMVLDNADIGYRSFIDAFLADRNAMSMFATSDVRFDNKALEWLETQKSMYFPKADDHVGSDLLLDLFHVSLHIGQSETAPRFFAFAERDNHDLDVIAQMALARKMDPINIHGFVENEYKRMDRYWGVLYPSYLQFKSHFDACLNRIIIGNVTENLSYVTTPEERPIREFTEDEKEQVLLRDNYTCLSCGEN